MNSAHLNYRSDIDGLRAFAVSSVVIFHAFPSLLPGGFVGVDIFFVISGFLISGMMFQSLKEGEFSFLDFYARRVNRIFPSLIFVLLVSLIFGWFVLFSDELQQLGNHVFRAAVFLSNFTLWKESGYFDNIAETKPLLHLWSLAIEEQFYIVWPVLIWSIWRLGKCRFPLIVALIISSFTWNVYQSQSDPSHDFYSPLTRFWELLSGALLAYVSRREFSYPKISKELLQRTDEFRGGLGIAMLVTAVLVTESLSFPGLWALLPVIGAVLIISDNSKGSVNRLVFSNSFGVWLGKISYPLYLWHWPIFSFARIVEGETPSVFVRTLCVTISILLAWATFSFYEKALRFDWKYRYKTIILVMGMLVTGVLGYLVYKVEESPSRGLAVKAPVIVNDGDIGHDSFHSFLWQHYFPCANQDVRENASVWRGVTWCFQSKTSTNIDLVLLGDSHAEHLLIGLAEALPNLNVAFYTKSAPPVLGTPEFDVIFKVLQTPQHRVRKVLIAANWDGKLKSGYAIEKLEVDLDKTVKMLRSNGSELYIMGDIPQFNFDPQRCKFHRPWTQITKCSATIQQYEQSMQSYVHTLQKIARMNAGTYYIDPSSWMCSATECSMALNGQLMYRDGNHLNITGSQYIASQILKQYPSLINMNN
jgi:peptidoglycan/LPS O-acetylase OafA/YrhL